MKILTVTCGLVACAMGAGIAHAQVAYTNSALNGCYAHLANSQDTGSAALNRDNVGTTCFDGKGNIVASATSPHLSGGVTNTDGTVAMHDDVTGTYKVTNSPGDGMGIFVGRCAKHAFVLRDIDNAGLAHGYSYILLTRDKKCKGQGPTVVSGSAGYQGPLK